MSQLEIAHECGRQQIACKLHQKCEQRSQTVIAQIDGFAEIVACKGLPDTHTSTCTSKPEESFRLPFFARHAHPKTSRCE